MSAATTSTTIAVTGASGQVGTLLREQLAESPNRVVPLNHGENWEPGIRSAQVVVHLAGTLQPKHGDTYESANVRTSEAVVSALQGSAVQRIVFLSYVGADEGSDNEYLRSKARAEAILADSGVTTTVFRCLHIFGPPGHPGPTAESFLANGRWPAIVLGSGRQRIAPLYIGDVVDAVLNAARQPESPSGVFELGGPEVMSIDDFVRVLNRGQVRIIHLPAPLARTAAHLSPALTPALVDLLLRDNVTSSDPSRVASDFGVSLHRLESVWSTPQEAR